MINSPQFAGNFLASAPKVPHLARPAGPGTPGWVLALPVASCSSLHNVPGHVGVLRKAAALAEVSVTSPVAVISVLRWMRVLAHISEPRRLRCDVPPPFPHKCIGTRHRGVWETLQTFGVGRRP